MKFALILWLALQVAVIACSCVGTPTGNPIPAGAPGATPTEVPRNSPTRSDTPASKVPSTAVAQALGALAGQVWFFGNDCPPAAVSGSQPKVPPCTGPYPNYPITVYAAHGKAVAGTTVSDHSGAYHIALPPGRYALHWPDVAQNLSPSRSTTTNYVTVVAGQTTRLDISIDLGMR